MRNEGYDSAQICLNGHIINSLASSVPAHNKKFCDECGAETITNCKQCNTSIKGTYHYSGIFPATGLGYQRPKYCDNCGRSFPWTENKLQAATELTKLAENLDLEEKNDLNKSIEDLVKETSNLPVAQLKVIKYLNKAGQEIKTGMRDILVDIISETVKRTIWNQ